MTIRAVVFDFYGTLTPSRTSDGQSAARRTQAEALGLDADRFDAEMAATVDDRFRGAGGDLPGSLAWLAARLGVTPSAADLARAADVRLTTERRFGQPRPEAADVLRTLRERGLRIGLVSDCSAELPVYFPDVPVAPLVDAAVFSFLVGAKKPDPRMYRLCCARLGVEPADCLYVGDGGSNELPGARDVGMRAVHLAVPDEAGGIVYGRHDEWDGETITSLGDVLTLLPTS